MAEHHTSFPKMIISNWWELRRQAQSDPDLVFTPKNLAKVLGINIMTVYGSAYPSLQHMGIIVRNGSLTERGRRWLNDAKYKEVCSEIVNEIYPNELIHGIDDPLHNREAVKDWFHETAGTNTNSVLQMTATYLLLLKAEVDEQYNKTSKKAGKATGEVTNAAAAPATINESAASAAEERVKRKYTRRHLPGQAEIPEATETAPVESKVEHEEALPVPFSVSTSAASAFETRTGSSSVNINIHLVITEETTPEQIEQIFRGIGHHLFNKED